MKKIAILPLLILSLLLGGVSPASAELKVGTVDMKKVFETFWRTKEAETKMNEVRATIKRELDDKSEKRKALEAEIMQFNEDLKKSEVADAKKQTIARDREKKIAEWQGVSKDFEAFTREKDKQLSEQTMRIRNGIVEEIKKVVDAYAVTENYNVVLDSSGNSINNVAVVLYSKKTFDFTPVITEKLNADRPKGGASAERLEEPAPAGTPAATPAAGTPKKK